MRNGLAASAREVMQTIQRQFGLDNRFGRADMHPQAFHAHAKRTAGEDRLVPDEVHRERRLRRGGKDAGVQEIDADGNEGHDLALAAAADAAFGVEREIATTVVADACRAQ